MASLKKVAERKLGVRIEPAQKILSFSLIERVILSAGAMLIFSVSFQIRPNARRRRYKALSNIYTNFFF